MKKAATEIPIAKITTTIAITPPLSRPFLIFIPTFLLVLGMLKIVPLKVVDDFAVVSLLELCVALFVVGPLEERFVFVISVFDMTVDVLDRVGSATKIQL